MAFKCEHAATFGFGHRHPRPFWRAPYAYCLGASANLTGSGALQLGGRRPGREPDKEQGVGWTQSPICGITSAWTASQVRLASTQTRHGSSACPSLVTHQLRSSVALEHPPCAKT